MNEVRKWPEAKSIPFSLHHLKTNIFLLDFNKRTETKIKKMRGEPGLTDLSAMRNRGAPQGQCLTGTLVLVQL